jgi:hypothetical protein
MPTMGPGGKPHCSPDSGSQGPAAERVSESASLVSTAQAARRHCRRGANDWPDTAAVPLTTLQSRQLLCLRRGLPMVPSEGRLRQLSEPLCHGDAKYRNATNSKAPLLIRHLKGRVLNASNCKARAAYCRSCYPNHKAWPGVTTVLRNDLSIERASNASIAIL